MAHTLNSLTNKKRLKGSQVVNRMVPTDKSKLTDMLHQYIQAHKPEKHKKG